MALPARSISVALCTYNGSFHLADQLKSLNEQTRLPDEVIVFDDASTDDTVDRLKHFANYDARFPVRIQVNEKTLGPTRNFEQAIAACTGEIIALCDQDDIWLPDKLAVIEAEFSRNSSLGFVFGDAEVCDETCEPLKYRLWNSVRFKPALQQSVDRGQLFDVLIRQNVVTGATMAFASRFKSLLLPIDPSWIHDGWIALILSAIAPAKAIHRPLVLYRQHSQQHIGAKQRSLYQEYLSAKKMDRDIFTREAEMYQAVLLRLSEVGNQIQPNALGHLQAKIAHLHRRSAIRQRKISRLFPCIEELMSLHYHRFSLGWKSAAQDLLL